MLKKIIIIILLSCVANIWGEINKYEYKLLKIFPIGSKNGEIGFNINAMEGAGRVAPLSFTISPDLSIFVADSVNMRIVVYNSFLSFDKNINSKYLDYDHQKMIIDEEHNIFVYSNYYGFEIIDKFGELSWKFKNYQVNKDEAKVNNYFYYNDYIFYYDINRNLIASDTNDNKYEKAELQAILNEFNNTYTVKSWRNLEDNNLQLKVKSFIQEKKINMIGNRILDKDYFKHKKYFEFLQKNMKALTMNNELSIELPKPMGVEFINYDAEDNSYWRYMTENRDFLIIVHNKYGKLIDAFDTIDYALYDITPNGDVYVLETHHEAVQANKGYNFYKIPRRW